MKPHLIIDIRDRGIFSLLMDEAGNTRPCTHNVSENVLRYFYGEVMVDLSRHEERKTKKLPDLSLDIENEEYDIIRTGKKLGWMRPYQTDKSAIAVKHPLKVLSSVFAQESKEIVNDVIATCYALLEFILEPVLHYIHTTSFVYEDLNVVFIIPGYFNRRAQLVLHKLMRRKKVNHTLMVTREMATMMACLEDGMVERAAILDMEDENTQLYQVKAGRSRNEVRLECTTGSTLANFGWQSLLSRFIHLINKEKLTGGSTVDDRLCVDNALMALIFGIQSCRFSLPQSINITHALFDELFTGKGTEASTRKYFSILSQWADKNGHLDEPFIPLGLPPMIGHFENLLFSVLAGCRQPSLLRHRSLERAAYGVATGINWLNSGAGRTIKMIHKAGFRVATRPGESILLAPYSAVPSNYGDQRVVKQVFDFCLEDAVEEDILTFQLLWGVNPNPLYNVNLCVLPLNVTREDAQKKQKVWVALDLKRTKTGGGLKGTVTVRLGEQMKQADFRIDQVVREVRSHDIN